MAILLCFYYKLSEVLSPYCCKCFYFLRRCMKTVLSKIVSLLIVHNFVDALNVITYADKMLIDTPLSPAVSSYFSYKCMTVGSEL